MTDTPRRAHTSHRSYNTAARTWCPHCGYHRHVYPATNNSSYPLVAEHSVYERPGASTRFVRCPGSLAPIVPDPQPLAHWTLHADECRTAAGLACMCVLAVAA